MTSNTCTQRDVVTGGETSVHRDEVISGLELGREHGGVDGEARLRWRWRGDGPSDPHSAKMYPRKAKGSTD